MSEPAQNVNQNPWEPIFHYAVQFHTAGRLAEAGSLFAAILEHNPDHYPSLHRLAAIRRAQGRFSDSVALLERAIAANPDAADARNSLANTLAALNRLDEAAAQYRAAIALRSDFAEAHFNLGRCLNAMARFAEAERAYRAAIALRPGYAEALSNLGTVLARLNRPAEAVDAFSAALASNPATRLGWNNLAMALMALNRHHEAAPLFERARELEPAAPQPVFNEAVLQLSLGDYARGFCGYEARWQVPELNLRPREFSQPRWDGAANPAGKTLFLHAEQGLGDTILFARFIAPLVERGARILVEVQKPLTRLLSSMPGVDRAIAPGDPLPEFDYHLPFGSLPFALRTTLDTLPVGAPYLYAPASTRPNGGAPRVGVCWAGNPEYGNDHNRSIPLGVFASLLRAPGIDFVSLQQKPREGDDAILAGAESIDLASISRVADLADTAALISTLDLVVTVDTVIAHLAGALNRPVWILLPFCAHWVWMGEGAQSRWYPSARLIRQPAVGDWAGAVREAVNELHSYVRR